MKRGTSQSDYVHEGLHRPHALDTTLLSRRSLVAAALGLGGAAALSGCSPAHQNEPAGHEAP